MLRKLILILYSVYMKRLCNLVVAICICVSCLLQKKIGLISLQFLLQDIASHIRIHCYPHVCIGLVILVIFKSLLYEPEQISFSAKFSCSCVMFLISWSKLIWLIVSTFRDWYVSMKQIMYMKRLLDNFFIVYVV